MPEPVGGTAVESSQAQRAATKLAWGGARAGAVGRAREGKAEVVEDGADDARGAVM
jgi:hypothetical protein